MLLNENRKFNTISFILLIYLLLYLYYTFMLFTYLFITFTLQDVLKHLVTPNLQDAKSQHCYLNMKFRLNLLNTNHNQILEFRTFWISFSVDYTNKCTAKICWINTLTICTYLLCFCWYNVIKTAK
jgi:hypothetical protein